MANIEIPVSLGLKDAQSQINQLRQALQQSVKLDSSAGKSLTSILDSAQKSVDKLTGKMSNAFKSASGSSSFLKDYEKMIELLTTATQKMTNLGVTDIKFSVSDQQVVDSTIQKIQSLQQALESIQDGKAIEVIKVSQVNGIDNLRQQLAQLKIDASKLSFSEIGDKLEEAANQANTEVKDLTNNIQNINSQIGKLNTQGFQDIANLSDFSTKGVSRILDAGNVDSVNDKLQKLAATMTDITVKPMTATAGQDITAFITSQTQAIEKQYNRQIQTIQSKKDEINSIINDVTQAGARTSKNGTVSYGHWTNEQMQQLMSMPSVENIIKKLKEDTSLNFDSLGIRQQFVKFREALNQELQSLNTQQINLQQLRDNVKTEVSKVFDNVGEAVVGSRSQLQSSIKSLFANLGISGDELKKIFDINSISSGEKMLDVINRIKAGLTSYIATLDKTANTDLAAKLQAAQTAFNDLTNAQNTNKAVSQESNGVAQSLQEQINTLAAQIQALVDKYNALTGSHITFDTSGIEGAKGQIESFIQSLNKLQQKQQSLSNIQMAVNRWMGFWQVLNMTKSAINDMKQHIQELDTVMTSISVVTNFSQEDLWGQISQYSKIARQYGVAIKGVYEVSQIYYQQGLQQNDVMTLTTETLKMARIAGLDYATAADYMTTAIRGFKLEMTDAAHVTDVFSALAATTASSTEEIAVAISKTAASAEAVGASFEATSAMMATMISTTRESATNIGTALKSVISRYGEMTSDPSKTVDSEGEEISLNRVDKALQTVGITIHDTAGQFRDFDDVMLELMEKWDSLDSLSQRYIATLMAGNRQQSRFLALVSNVDEYKKALQTAMDSEGTGELQTLKTLDSIDAKIEKMKVTIQEFYTSSGLEELYKNILDTITNIVVAANSLPKMFGKIPGQAIAIGASIISTIKSVLTLFINSISAGLDQIKGKNTSLLQAIVEAWSRAGTESATKYKTNQQAVLESGQVRQNSNLKAGRGKTSKELSSTGKLISTYAGAAASIIGSLFTTTSLAKYGASSSINQDKEAGIWGIAGGLSSIVGGGLTGLATGGPIGALLGTITSAVTQIPSIASAVDMISISSTRRVELAEKAATEAKTEATKQKAETSNLAKAVDTYKELEAKAYSSAEAMQEFKDHMNTLAESYPNLISRMDESGNYIVELETLEGALAAAREKTAIATANATKAELDAKKETQEVWQEAYNKTTNLEDIRTTSDDQWAAERDNWEDLWIGYGFSREYKEFGETAKEKILGLYNALVPENQQLEQLGDFSDEKVRNQVNQVISGFKKLNILNIYNTLEDQVKNLQTIDSSLSLEELTGFSDWDVIDNSPVNILKAAQRLNQRAKEYVSHYSNLIDNIGNVLVSERADITIQRVSKQDLSDTFDYEKHGKTIQSLMSHNKKLSLLAQQDTEESEEFEQAADKRTLDYLDYFKSHTQTLKYIEEDLNLDEFSSLSLLKKELNKNIAQDDSGIDEEIQKIYIKQWQDNRNDILNRYRKQRQQIFGTNEIPSEFFTEKFTNSTLLAIQNDFTKYSSIQEGGNFAKAGAYLNNMKAVYGAIKQLSNSEQLQIAPLIQDLDLSNPEELRSVSDTLTNMGGKFAEIAPVFTNAANRWATSAATLLESLSSSTQETAKSIESSIADMSKTFKYSEALEKAQALIDANKDQDLEFNQLYTFDKDAGGYIKTADALMLELQSFNDQQSKAIEQSIEDYGTTLNKLSSYENINYRNRYNKSKQKKTPEEIQQAQEEVKQQFAEYLGLTDDESQIDLDRLWSEYTTMIEAYESTPEDTRGRWDDFVDTYLKEHSVDLQKKLEEIKQMPQKLALEELQSFDYTSIASGKGTTQSKEELKALITTSLKEGTQFDFNTFWENLLKGNIDSANEALAKADLGQISKNEFNRTRFESLTNLYNKIASGDVIFDALTKDEQILLNSVLKEDSKLSEGDGAEKVGAAADNVWQAIIALIAAGAGTLNEVADTVANKANQNFKDSNAGKQYDLLTSYKDGFTSTEAQNLGFLDENGNLKEKFTQYLEQNSAGNWVAKAGQDAASVITELAGILGIAIDKTTTEYKTTIKESVDTEIANLDSKNTDKQFASVLSQMSSASEGTLINISQISPAARNRLIQAGYDISGNILKVGNEAAMNAALVKLEQQSTSGGAFWKKNALSQKELTKQIDAYNQKTSKYTGLSGALGSTVSSDAATKLANSFGKYGDDVKTFMESLGFIFEKNSNLYLATDDSIASIQEKIVELSAELDNVEDPAQKQYLQEQIATFQATLDDLRDSKTYKRINALTGLLGNYTDVTNQNIQDFQTQFSELTDININDYLVTSDLTGKRSLKIEELRKALEPYSEQLGIDINQAFADYVGAYADTYTKSVSDAISYSKSGTTSLKEMEDFVKNYNELLGESITTDEAFAYDSELQSWLLNSDLMLKYAQARAQQLGLIDADLETYINDLLKSDVANQIDQSLSGLLEGSEKDTQDLQDALSNYYKNFYENERQSAINNAKKSAQLLEQRQKDLYTHGKLTLKADNKSVILDSGFDHVKTVEEIETEYAQKISNDVQVAIDTLKAGGSNAVAIYKIFNPDATEEELAKIYSAAFDNWSSVVKQLSEVTQGSFVTGHLRDILAELNMLDGENVVNSSFDMVAVYRNIYSQMAKTNGATISGLNDVYAELLTAEDRQNVDIVDMLKNASGMSYDSLGKLLARYNITLEQVLQNEATAAQFGLERTGFGQVRLTNWDAFAKSVFNTDDLKALYNNPDYISAYHSYIDGLITINETAEEIIQKGVADELTSLGKIKRGDTLNFSYLDRAFNDILEHRYDQFTTNNVKNLGNRVEVSPEVMNKAFGKFNWFEPLQEGDYATIFGRTFTGKQFEGIEDNIGISIAQIDEAGNAITDVQGYLQFLIDEAIKLEGFADTSTIRALDKKYMNLIMDTHNYDKNLSDDTIWKSQDEITQIIHEAEELPKKIADYKDQLAMFGATFENGILDISEDANLINIASVFQAMINDSGLQLTDTTRAAFEDSIQQIISTYTTAITKGIEGGLTNVEANDLRMQAADLGISNITFEQTTKGLQLSQKSAIELYQAMAKVDGLQGKILFDKLADQLSKANENFASTEALLNHMVDLSTKLAKVDGKVPDSRRAEYEAELAIAKEIVAVRSTQKDESFNFMSNKIPEGQNNPLNYAKNWTQAIKAINDAYKVKNTKDLNAGGVKHTQTGYMAYENFYNIINEINNMAGIMGKPITVGKTIEDGALTLDGSLESASNLIIKGIKSLTAVDTGEMMVNIGGLGISLAKGGKELKSGIDDGIDAIADAQISALDGTIAMLELIVAMESLGDIAADDIEITLPDIVVNGEFTEQWNTSLKNLQDYYKNNKDFQKVANGIVIDNKKFMDWMERDASKWDDADAAFLNALYKAAESTNWNLDKVADSLQGFLSGSGIEKFNKTFSLTLNDISYVVSHGVVIEVADWTNENTKAVLQEYMKKSGKSEEDARADILTALESYSKGEGTTGDVTIEEVLRVKHSTLIQHDKKGSYVEDSKGNKHYEGSAEYTEAVDKAIMADMKDITSGENITVKEKVIETDYGIKNKIHMKGTLQVDKSMKWEVTDLPKEFEDFEPSSNAHSQSAVLQEMYDWGIGHDKITETQFPTKEAWIYQTFGYHVAINTEILKDGKQVTDPSKDPKFRQGLKDFQKQTDEQIKEKIEAGKDSEGYVTINIGDGYKMKFNWDEISTDGENVNMDLLMEKLFGAGGGDSALKDTIIASITAALTELPNLIANIKSDGIESLAAAMKQLADAAQLLQNTQWGTISEGINSLNNSQQKQQQNQNSDNQSTTETTNITTIVTKFEPDTAAVENAKKEISDEPVTMKIDGDERDAVDAGERAKAAINAMRAFINISTTGNATSAINSIRNALTNLANGGRPYVANIQARVIPTKPGKAAGTLGLAQSKGTLMGELGPELVVSKGRYFVVGQSGPEMVDLDDDAIVFNHLQTQSLLTKGMSSGRGRAVTNERNAVSFATGNIGGGPAMASASAALAALKQLRAMWESLRNASVSDLAGAGGGGGGGGGGNKIVDPKAWVKTVERWYNLTQEIAKLEKDITHEETLRSKLQSDFSKNGKHYYNSQRLSLKALREQIAAQEQLNLSRQDYYTKRIDALKNEPLGKLYTFDEQGQMHFRDDVTMNGQKGAMNFLTDLMGFDENGKANYTNEQKYNILKQYGFDEYMKYNSNGEQILLDADHSGDVTDEERETYYQQATEAWRDRMDNFASETQSLWDSIQEGENSLLELQADQNEILQEMRDNQIAVEEDVLKAIEDMRQREIDALQDERDKLEDSTGKYIEGLSDALSKEQEMYDNQQQENDLNQQRRRLAILQRSGGSAADIANLQNEINSNERSRYFDLQQQQIDAIQQASDLQLERMDNQIELMTETLEYQKEYGLLWSEVYDVMSHSAAQITSFIMNGNSEFWAKSPLGSATSANDTLFKADQWVEFRKDMTDVTTDVANLAFAANEQKKANDYKIYDSAMKKEFGSNYDSQGKYKGIFEQVYDETGDITKASAAARAEYQKDEKAKKLNRPTYTINTPQLTAPSSTDSSSGSSNNNNKCKGCAAECTKGCAYSCTGKCVKGCKGVCGTDCERGCATGCKESCKGKCTTECYSSCLGGCKGSSSFSAQTYTSSLPKKAKGGFVNHGVYELGEEGTEGVLNAHQTRILRDNILSNKPNSLITLLNTYNEAYKDGISVAPQEASGQLIIENATVNMNVEQIANDYDARRAGEQALNEMMRIARKTGAANSIRR